MQGLYSIGNKRKVRCELKGKNKTIILITGLGGILSVFLLLFLLFGRVNIDKETDIFLVSVSQGNLEREKLSEQDAEVVRQMLHGSILFPEQLSCGFSDDFSISVGERKLLIAGDGCPYIYDCKTGMYFRISLEERKELLLMFSKYGLQSRKH